MIGMTSKNKHNCLLDREYVLLLSKTISFINILEPLSVPPSLRYAVNQQASSKQHHKTIILLKREPINLIQRGQSRIEPSYNYCKKVLSQIPLIPL